MKKFLMSSLKIGLGIFIAFILLGIVGAIIAPDNETPSTDAVELPAETRQAAEVETPAQHATVELPVETKQAEQPSTEVTTLEQARTSEPDPVETPEPEPVKSSEPTYDDLQWINVVATDASATGPLMTDMNNVGYACTNAESVGMTQIGIYAGDLFESSGAAYQRSNRCSVSPELQPAKDEYEQGLSDINTGSRFLIGGVDAYNEGDADTAISTFELAKTFIDSGGQHFTTATNLLNAYNKKMGYT
jgi:hypothetical protein